MKDDREPVDVADLLGEPTKLDLSKPIVWHVPEGPWAFDAESMTIDLGPDGIYYWIDLERCQTSAEVLDIIMQVAGKSWATDEVLAHLVRMIDTLLHPQGSLCSFGQEKGPYDARPHIRARIEGGTLSLEPKNEFRVDRFGKRRGGAS